MEEVGDSDLMGGGGDGVEDFRARRKEQERRKTEREVRREEMLRARAAERSSLEAAGTVCYVTPDFNSILSLAAT